MENTRPGFITLSGIISGLLTVLVVVVTGLIRGGTLFSPGRLNSQANEALGGINSHADLSNKCSTCHPAFWEKATMSDRCVACHTNITTQQQDPTTMHGIRYKDNPDLPCWSCHIDHKGATASLTDLRTAQLSHEATGYSIIAHQIQADGSAFSCRNCHKSGYGLTTFDREVCSTCHQQINDGFMQSHLRAFGNDCLACHDGKDTYGHSFNHQNVSFQLTGKHAPVSCEKCHQNASTLADLRAKPTNCVSCHKPDNPHSDRIGTDCAACHKTDGWSPATINHELTAFILEGKHVDVACESCHINHVFKGTARDCNTCHNKDDKHKGQYGSDCALCHDVKGWPTTIDHNQFSFTLTGKHVNAACTGCHVNATFKGTPLNCVDCHGKINPHSTRLGNNCGNCHTADAWLPASFDHNLAAFRLGGKHAGVACENCHINKLYQGTPSDCYSCHKKDDKHKGQYGTNCALCHKDTGWPTTIDHNLFAFKLTGKHAGVACASCHVNGVFKGTPSNCAGCHGSANPHSSRLGTNCGNCHSTSGWQPASFDHNLAAFKLTGSHIKAVCTSCHVNNVFRGTPTNCNACHAKNDRHNGQLGTNCNSCHSTNAWLPSTFDHSSASFKLTGKHVQVACSACHINGVYKGTPTNCNACHAKKDPHAGQFGTDCGACHKTSGWLPATFDHNLAAFKLTGKHIQVACTGCHINGVFKGTPTNCNACHAKNDAHNGQYGSNCGSCHTTSGWKPANFDHSGFALTNGHAGLSCNSCHSSGKFSGLSTACSSCHTAPASHAGINDGCKQCHTTSDWNSNFDHPNKCDGSCTSHHHATCSDCHGSSWATATCTKCHDSNNPDRIGGISGFFGIRTTNQIKWLITPGQALSFMIR